MVRNFSRGRFSVAKIQLKIASSDLGRTLPLLEELAEDAVSLLPNLAPAVLAFGTWSLPDAVARTGEDPVVRVPSAEVAVRATLGLLGHGS